MLTIICWCCIEYLWDGSQELFQARVLQCLKHTVSCAGNSTTDFPAASWHVTNTLRPNPDTEHPRSCRGLFLLAPQYYKSKTRRRRHHTHCGSVKGHNATSTNQNTRNLLKHNEIISFPWGWSNGKRLWVSIPGGIQSPTGHSLLQVTPLLSRGLDNLQSSFAASALLWLRETEKINCLV